jgi:hypothetical protein
MSNRFYLFMLIGCLLMAACNNDDKKAATVTMPVVQKPVLTDPFRFHKRVEVSPGEDYDVLSWGRGSATTGAFLILHSDSVDKKYVTTTGDLDGAIIDVYNSDMDLDGNPEILIQAKGKDTTNYATIYAYEFTNGKADKLDFPKLTSSQKKGYRGDDNFYITQGKLMREFPIYDGNTKDAKPTGAKRILEYGLRSNNFTVKQFSKDSTDKTTNTSSLSSVKSASSLSSKKQSSSSNTSSKKSKKHTTEKKKKKHIRHHSSDDN